jgi:hypothetical protein
MAPHALSSNTAWKQAPSSGLCSGFVQGGQRRYNPRPRTKTFYLAEAAEIFFGTAVESVAFFQNSKNT